MKNTVMNSQSIKRLTKLINDRFGKQLKIQWMREVSSLEIQEGRAGSVHFRRDALSIPISFDNKYFATALVEDARSLIHEDLLILTELVKMVLEPEFYNFYLSQTFNNSLNASNEVPSIVVIRREDDSQDETTGTTLVCLQAVNPALINRIANEVHEITARWASLRFSDIGENIYSESDLIALGNITLIVDDILQLHPQHQEIIYRYLLTHEAGPGPLFVIGTASTIESLESQDMIHVGLGQLLKEQRLDVERLPRDSARLHETLEIMLQV
jgi:hypothetical protein